MMQGQRGQAVGRQWALRFGVMAMLAAGLTACGGQPASQPATSPPSTSLPAATESAPETATSAPAATAAASGSPVSAAMGSPVSAVSATPVSAASGTPVSSLAGTPIAEVNPERLAADCADYNAWLNNPDVKASLEKMSLWPAVIAEGEKAAAGQPIDKAAMQQDFDQMDKLGKALRTTNLTEGDHEPLQLAGRAMGLTSRLAGGLATGTLDQQAAGEAVAATKSAIAAYQEDAAARSTACAAVG